ncbi:MAG: biotin--[acetyl-CoA-carboxylase] ligase [candidate division Zixibacteria bacterium]|nr:biotin--[acetyl-CoA-carboxylase] ligase [candidate division Zixibacteria bacterium]
MSTSGQSGVSHGTAPTSFRPVESHIPHRQSISVCAGSRDGSDVSVIDPLADDVIHHLRTTDPPPSESQLADTLSVTRARLARIFDELTVLGYVFETTRNGAVHIAHTPDRMIDTEIVNGLRTRTFGRTLHCYRQVGSTNITAIELAESGAPEGTVVVAEEQTRGRGRLGRNWHSSPGLGIWSSVVLRPNIAPDAVTGISIVAALAFAETVDNQLGLDVQLKWPNDGLIDNRKVCGILVELSAEVGRLHYAVCGTGINVAHKETDFPAEIRPQASSLTIATGRPVDRLAFYRQSLFDFEELYQTFMRDGLAPLLPIYRARSILLGQTVTVTQGETHTTGLAEEIDECGRLIVRSAGQRVALNSGEATLRADM